MTWKEVADCDSLVFDRVTMELDTKVPNAAMFTINKDDHTVGNMIRMWGSSYTMIVCIESGENFGMFYILGSSSRIHMFSSLATSSPIPLSTKSFFEFRQLQITLHRMLWKMRLQISFPNFSYWKNVSGYVTFIISAGKNLQLKLNYFLIKFTSSLYSGQ